MRVITISIKIKARELNEEEKDYIEAYRRKVSQAWQTAKVATLERLRDLLKRWETYQANKHKEYMEQWPPHSLFCEKRCCHKAFTSYHRYLKRELKWNKQGHLR